MENKLEQLLNMLIQKGWKPRWEDKIHSCRYYEEEKKFKADYTIAWIPQVLYRSLTELCSKSSWLWQFVCENGMIKHDQYTNTTRIQEYEDERDSETYRTKYDEWSYLFRLIESSLKDESELEDFLLSNIKVDE